jgi:hypothetical protein
MNNSELNPSDPNALPVWDEVGTSAHRANPMLKVLNVRQSSGEAIVDPCNMLVERYLPLRGLPLPPEMAAALPAFIRVVQERCPTNARTIKTCRAR